MASTSAFEANHEIVKQQLEKVLKEGKKIEMREAQRLSFPPFVASLRVFLQYYCLEPRSIPDHSFSFILLLEAVKDLVRVLISSFSSLQTRFAQ